jgi:hypothetical protein
MLAMAVGEYPIARVSEIKDKERLGTLHFLGHRLN